MKCLSKLLLLSILLPTLGACSNVDTLPTVERVDLERFMGDWFVIANIPTAIEKTAYNAVESYRLDDDGTIATTFTFRDGGFEGKAKEYSPRGFVRNTETNAEWGMRFIWPIKADYRIVHLDPEYSVTIIGRNKRDYVWIMARESQLDDALYEELVQRVGDMGYDTSEIRKVPQQW